MKWTALAVILATAMSPAWAQDPNAGDAPDHGVARLSFVQGNVSMRHGDMGELSPVAVNVPLVTTDRVETGDQGFAEIQFDFLNMIRLGNSTEVRLSQLEYKHYQVQIAAGTTTFRVLRDNDAQVEISTPTVSIHPTHAGTYRISVRPDGITEITVRAGQAEIWGPRGSENLAQGQTMQARGSADDPEFQIVSAIPLDDFDKFNIDRDRVMQQSTSARNLPPDVAGGESLDPYGQWQNDPNYGQVWVPNEPPGWAPYQNGNWVDEDYYGWTWVSADPWGWAPYHYGSWYMGPWGGWAWYPGVFAGPHYWRPALVGFFGWGVPGFGVGIGFGFGHVGWVPLGPFEAFHPWYGAGAVAGARAGVGVNLGVANTFRNARVAGAISSVSAANFGRGAVRASTMVRPTNADLARASAIRGALPGIQATSASRRVADGAVNTRGMPQTNSNTRFATRPAGANTAARSGAGTAPAWRTMNGYNAGGTSASTARGTPGANGAQSNYRGGAQQGSYATSPQGRAPAQQQPLRMNPQIVQQRSATPYQAPAPAQHSAPAPARGGGMSAPSHGGGAPSHGGGGGHGGHR
ncbi:MAG TPA: DUF6600 domain-containing protein [Bryobacteraceae bacterium]|jgi:hypothetical protein